jgi:hypothetical protein
LARSEDGPIFKAATMDEKWDIYLHRPFLYFARSWTGDLIYRTCTDFADGDSTVVEIVYDASTNESAEFAIRSVDFLSKSHCLGAAVANPPP